MNSIFSKYTKTAFALLASAMFSSCALDTVPAPTYSRLMIINAVPAASSSAPLAAGTAPRLQINVDGLDLMNDSLGTLGTKGYLSLSTGAKSVKLNAANSYSSAGITAGQNFHTFSFPGEADKYTSAFVYNDNGTLASLLVNDDLKTPASGKVHVRVVNLLASDIDVFATTTGTEGSAVVTSSPVLVVGGVKSKQASAFTPIDAVPLKSGSALPSFVRKNYTFQVRVAGAATNLIQYIPSTNNANANTASLENQRIFTIFVSGTVARPSVLGYFNIRK